MEPFTTGPGMLNPLPARRSELNHRLVAEEQLKEDSTSREDEGKSMQAQLSQVGGCALVGKSAVCPLPKVAPRRVGGTASAL